jgi:hypothetical protein
MRNKEQKGDLSVQAIAGTHVMLLGWTYPSKIARVCLDLLCDEKIIPKERNIGCRDIRLSKV